MTEPGLFVPAVQGPSKGKAQGASANLDMGIGFGLARNE